MLFPDEDGHLAHEELIPTAKETDQWEGETRYQTKAGDSIIVDQLISCTSEDAIICTISEAENVEEVKEELSVKERAMDEAPIGITISDPSKEDNPLIYANDAYSALTGYDQDELVGRNCRFLQGEATREAPTTEIRQAINAEEPVSVELRNYRKDGELFWNRVTIAPLYDDNVDVEHFVGFQENVTPYRKLLTEFNNLGRVMAHDMQNPLQTVRMRLELAIEKDEVNHVAKALSSVERLEQLIDDVAGVLKSGTVVGERERLDVGSVAKHVWEALDRYGEEDAIKIEGSVTVRGNKNAVRRMFDNVLGNSKEHGEPPVKVRVGELEEGFYVEDNGPGIPESHREKVFEHGFSTKETDSGTGMGMASVHQIVLAHGWRIDITDAEEFDGTRFEITVE